MPKVGAGKGAGLGGSMIGVAPAMPNIPMKPAFGGAQVPGGNAFGGGFAPVPMGASP